MPRYAIVAGLIWFLAASSAACASAPQAASHSQATLTVFAAASLTDAFREIGHAFEAAHPGTQVVFNFAGSQQLAVQIEQGAQADVLAAADERNMARVVAAGLIAPGAPATFARNQLLVALPADNPAGVETLHDLARPGLKLVLAGESVPAGAYTRQMLEKLSSDPAFGTGFGPAVLANVVSNEENVKQVIAKLQLGEADAGIVYRSDVMPGLVDKLGWIEIPEGFNVTATYPIGMLEAASRPDLARQFVAFVRGPQGQRILQAWGLLPTGE